MEKKLPKVFVNPINKVLENNKEVYYESRNERKNIRNINVPEKINEIFASRHHVYKSRVRITTANDTFETVIVGSTGANLLTLSGDKININSIEDIERL